jgi:hypothetical protein
MVKRFKIMHDTVTSYEIDQETVEKVLQRNLPWYRRNASSNMRFVPSARIRSGWSM